VLNSLVPALQPVAALARRPRHEARNIGVHLPTNDHLFASDRAREWWKANGRDGSRTVKCLGCVDEGLDNPWLTFAGGRVQTAHLRHPPVAGIAGEPKHAPESSWHLLGKQVVAKWANNQSTVLSATPETRVAENGVNRRADVLVKCRNGRSAIELQYSPITADTWTGRQDDYRRADFSGYWFFDAHNAPSLEAGSGQNGLNCFIFDPEEEIVGVLMAGPAPREDGWWDLDPALLTHHIAHEGEPYGWFLPLPLADFSMDDSGNFVLPPHHLLNPDLTQFQQQIAHQKKLNAGREALAKAGGGGRTNFGQQTARLQSLSPHVLGDHPAIPRSGPRSDVVAWCEDRFQPGDDTDLLAEQMSGLATSFESHEMGLPEAYRAVRLRRLHLLGRSGLPDLQVF
jgi:hypothetical protein